MTMAKGKKGAKWLHSLKSVAIEDNPRLWWTVTVIVGVLWVSYTFINASDLVGRLTVEVLTGIAALVVFFYTPFIVLSLHYEGDESLPWDNKVILDKVADIFGVIAYMLLCLIVPITVWNLIPVNCDWQGRAKIFVLGIFAIGVGAFITYTVRLARWFYNATDKVSADYRTKLRVKYLEKLPENEQLSVWGPATWDKLEKQPSPNAREIISVFFDQLSGQSDNTHIRSIALLDFLHNIDTAHLYDSYIYKKALNFSITHGFDASVNRQAKIKSAPYSIQMENTAQDLFQAITKRSIYNPAKSNFFSTIQKRLKDNGTKLNKKHMINAIMQEIFVVLEDNPMSKDSVWHFFCDEWKISVENIKNDTPAVDCLEAYIEWFTRDYINKLHPGPDKNYDKMYALHGTHASILSNMFIGIDSHTWLTLMVLQYLPYPPDGKGDKKSDMRSRMKNYVSSNVVELVTMLVEPVGGGGRNEYIGTAQKPIVKKSKKQYHETTDQEKNVLDLAKHTRIFPEFRDMKRLEEFIDASRTLLKENNKLSQKNTTVMKLRYIIKILNKLKVD